MHGGGARRRTGAERCHCLKHDLRSKVENTIHDRFGYIVKVIKIDTERLEGKISPTGIKPGGTATFQVPYDAIVFKIFKNQVLNGIVSESGGVSKTGCFVNIGPLKVFVASANMTGNSTDDSRLQWDPSHSPPCWKSGDGTTIIKEGYVLRPIPCQWCQGRHLSRILPHSLWADSAVAGRSKLRVQVMGIRAGEHCVGTILGHGLGSLDHDTV